MGTAAEHEEKAAHHLEFLAEISDRYPDWLATVAFYAAVECVERLFARYDIHSRDHEDRKRFVRQRYPSIFGAYKALYNASLDARYEGRNRWLPVEEVRRNLIARHLGVTGRFKTSHREALQNQPICCWLPRIGVIGPFQSTPSRNPLTIPVSCASPPWMSGRCRKAIPLDRPDCVGGSCGR